MRALTRRLQRLEATAARLDPSKREREFEEFRRTAEGYIRAAREYLGEPLRQNPQRNDFGRRVRALRQRERDEVSNRCITD